VARHVLLLRGINLGPRNRIAMPDLRAALEDAGFANVRTYVQSGNVIASAAGSADEAAKRCATVVAESFGLDIAVVARTHAQLAAVVKRDPLGKVATNPKRYQVAFLAKKLPAATVKELEAAAAGDERVVVSGREVYAWHPDGVARSKLWALIASRDLGVTATARNWTTVTALLGLAGEG
jgi:uncharacterized protein (DUF1697 family)